MREDSRPRLSGERSSVGFGLFLGFKSERASPRGQLAAVSISANLRMTSGLPVARAQCGH
jgi:hypothetical protein